MSPAHVLEPTYRRLKRAVMDGTWPGGTRLEAQRLADELGVSMTPVRDSLNQLVGEGLVDLTPGEGFRVPVLTEQGLRDTLNVNAALLETATDSDWTLPKNAVGEEHQTDYSDRLAAAFSTLATGSSNRFLADTINRISDRLHFVRNREPDVLPRAGQALAQIEASLRKSRADRQQAVRRYHRECEEVVPQLVNCLSSFAERSPSRPFLQND